jgi:hypothetical protein
MNEPTPTTGGVLPTGAVYPSTPATGAPDADNWTNNRVPMPSAPAAASPVDTSLPGTIPAGETAAASANSSASRPAGGAYFSQGVHP